tara:strand:+ start:135 stop:704 length:570 start_codon:yes stop_codon:yes gene_type:complete
MRLLREYIRQLLTESAIHPKIMSMIDRLENEEGGKVRINRYQVLVRDYQGKTLAQVSFDPTDGMYGNCSGASIVSFSEAEGGYGPLAYDIAIEATGGLAPDRTEVSGEAEAVWSRYESYRDDVKVDQLDIPEDYGEPQLTPDDPSDDCEQVVAYDMYQDGWAVSPLSKKYSKSGTPVIDELRKRGMIKE